MSNIVFPPISTLMRSPRTWFRQTMQTMQESSREYLEYLQRPSTSPRPEDQTFTVIARDVVPGFPEIRQDGSVRDRSRQIYENLCEIYEDQLDEQSYRFNGESSAGASFAINPNGNVERSIHSSPAPAHDNEDAYSPPAIAPTQPIAGPSGSGNAANCSSSSPAGTRTRPLRRENAVIFDRETGERLPRALKREGAVYITGAPNFTAQTSPFISSGPRFSGTLLDVNSDPFTVAGLSQQPPVAGPSGLGNGSSSPVGTRTSRPLQREGAFILDSDTETGGRPPRPLKREGAFYLNGSDAATVETSPVSNGGPIRFSLPGTPLGAASIAYSEDDDDFYISSSPPSPSPVHPGAGPSSPSNRPAGRPLRREGAVILGRETEGGERLPKALKREGAVYLNGPIFTVETSSIISNDNARAESSSGPPSRSESRLSLGPSTFFGRETAPSPDDDSDAIPLSPLTPLSESRYPSPAPRLSPKPDPTGLSTGKGKGKKRAREDDGDADDESEEASRSSSRSNSTPGSNKKPRRTHSYTPSPNRPPKWDRKGKKRTWEEIEVESDSDSDSERVPPSSSKIDTVKQPEGSPSKKRKPNTIIIPPPSSARRNNVTSAAATPNLVSPEAGPSRLAGNSTLPQATAAPVPFVLAPAGLVPQAPSPASRPGLVAPATTTAARPGVDCIARRTRSQSACPKPAPPSAAASGSGRQNPIVPIPAPPARQPRKEAAESQVKGKGSAKGKGKGKGRKK